jgi:hypothetical protein
LGTNQGVEMKKTATILLFLCTIITAQQPVILVMKTVSHSGLESETDALPEIVASKLSKYENYRTILWDEIEAKLGKEKMSKINRCQDSASVVGFTEVVKQYKLSPTYMLFCSVAKFEEDYTITLKIADAVKGTTFGMVSTTCSNLESFHSSGIIESVIRKIPAYVSRTTNTTPLSAPVYIPGIQALGSDTSYNSKLIRNMSELRPYINLFNNHDERTALLINTEKPIDTIKFPSVAIFKPDTRDSLAKNALITIFFTDSLPKNKIETPVSVSFIRGNSNLITQVVFKSSVPSQSRYGTDYYDMKNAVLKKITSSNFSFTKSDSSSGLYGVSYHYYYTKKNNLSDVNLSFTADVATFSLVIK